MIKSIFAVDHWGGMGYKGTLPWPHCKEDLARFQSLTKNHIVIMGRRTWDDPKMPKPLPNRVTYVVSHRAVGKACTIEGDVVEQILKIQHNYANRDVWIIGGPQLLLDTKCITQEAHIAHFRGQYKVDVDIDLRQYLTGFQARSAKSHPEYTCNWMVYKKLDNT